jgi:hypothetical protein
MHLVVNLSVTSGTGIGSVCNFFIANYNRLDWHTLTLDGIIPSSVDKRNFTWKWKVYAIPAANIGAYCAATTNTYSNHTFYTLLSTPQAPMAEPQIHILDYACEWASGENTSNDICQAILNNGFNNHYTWNYDCMRLSSDFVYLVTSLGISASQHKWSSLSGYYIGDMITQLTRSFDPVGPAHDQKAIPWAWHQWAEAASYQRDPSANKSVVGNWGAYEDYVFTHYERVISSSPFSEWITNPSGGQYSPSSLRTILKKAAIQAGITQRVHLHQLRHSYATHLIEQGEDITKVQEILGHADDNYTTLHTHFAY